MLILQLDLGLSQIFPIADEDIDEERRVISASFADPYAAILRDDSSIMVLAADDNGDIDEVDKGDVLLASKWLSASVYRGEANGGPPMLYLLSAEGGLYVRFRTQLMSVELTVSTLRCSPCLI